MHQQLVTQNSQIVASNKHQLHPSSPMLTHLQSNPCQELNQSDYPKVQFWDLTTWRKQSKEVKGMSRIDYSGDKGQKFLSAYLEDENGNRVSHN
jgi:hypothetical protein